MPRPPRIDFPGALHHVMNRGARRAAMFGERWQTELFLTVLAELPTRFGVRILAFVVMPNHFHLLLECPLGNLSLAMKFLEAEFTQRMNRLRQWDGPVFRGRFMSRLVETDAYEAHLYAYIHLNPVRGGLAQTADTAAWTSHRALLGLDPKPHWLDSRGIKAAFRTEAAYREYLDACLSHNPPEPPGWERGRLWVRPATSRVAPIPSPIVPEAVVPAALAEVSRVTGVSVEELLKGPRGRRRHPARDLAGWWLVQRTKATTVAVGRWLGCTGPRVSQMCGAVNRNEPVFGEWRRALQRGQDDQVGDDQVADELPSFVREPPTTYRAISPALTT